VKQSSYLSAAWKEINTARKHSHANPYHLLLHPRVWLVCQSIHTDFELFASTFERRQ
jgi:hypothetical protein